MKSLRFTLTAVVLALAAAVPFPARAQSLASQLKNYYGFTRGGLVVEKTVTCATTPTKVFNSDPSRLWDLEIDTGANNCTISRNSNLTTSNGILLVNTGGSYNETWVEDGFIVGYEMWCICSSGSSTLFVQEQKSQ